MNDFFSEDNRIIFIVTLGATLLSVAALIFILFLHVSRKKIIQKELEKKSLELAHQQHILQTSINAQEAERTRIAQDLHDAVSARLNVISLTANVLLEDPKVPREQKTALHHIVEVTASTLESSREIAHHLMPAIFDKFGLKAAFEELFEDFTKSKQLHINYSIDDLSVLDKPGELHLFRIVQELINNSVRHGKATVLSLKSTREEQRFTIRYQDNGIGFNPDASGKNTGIGLQNIKSRVAILNGALHIKSHPDQGSTFTLTIPYNE